MIRKLQALWRAFRDIYSREACYSRMEDAGIAIFGCCSGVVGGDSTTEYLAHQCMDCKYWTPVD